MKRNQPLNCQRWWLEIMVGTVMLLLATPVKAELVNDMNLASNDATTQTKSAKKTPKKAKAPATKQPVVKAEVPPVVTPVSAITNAVNNVPIADIKILSPAVDAVLDTSAATVVLQFKQGSDVELRANGTVIARWAASDAASSASTVWFSTVRRCPCPTARRW